MSGRYAIYFTPQPGGPLAEFGARWLGWDCAEGAPRAQPDMTGLDMEGITRRPRKYGFHATLKPPFHLAAGLREEALIDALQEFCERRPALTLAGLHLSRIGSFLALVPTEADARIGALAADVVQSFDAFRAPHTPDELARRQNHRLSPRQRENLERWGYPYVMEDFRFHMTLTGALGEATRMAAEAALEGCLAEISLAPVEIDALTLLKSDAAGRFASRARVPLAAA